MYSNWGKCVPLMEYKRNPVHQQEISLSRLDEGNRRRFLKFCKRIIYKALRQFHEAKEDLQGQLIQLP